MEARERLEDSIKRRAALDNEKNMVKKVGRAAAGACGACADAADVYPGCAYITACPCRGARA